MEKRRGEAGHSVSGMTNSLPTPIRSITLEVADVAAAQRFYAAAFGGEPRVRLAEGSAPSEGFRGYALSVIVAEPAVVDGFSAAALAAGAEQIKPPRKSFWGYGAAFRAPDGTVWTVASSSKKNTGAPLGVIDDIVLLLGAGDVAATKAFYLDHGLAVSKSFGRKYVEFESSDAGVKLAVQSRRAVAKNAGVAAEGSGSHRLLIDGAIGALTDPDGYAWQ